MVQSSSLCISQMVQSVSVIFDWFLPCEFSIKKRNVLLVQQRKIFCKFRFDSKNDKMIKDKINFDWHFQMNLSLWWSVEELHGCRPLDKMHTHLILVLISFSVWPPAVSRRCTKVIPRSSIHSCIVLTTGCCNKVVKFRQDICSVCG